MLPATSIGEKFNPNHDARGRFASGGSTASLESREISMRRQKEEHGYAFDSNGREIFARKVMRTR